MGLLIGLLSILGTMSISVSAFMLLGLRIAKINAGVHADTKSFLVVIIPALIFAVICFGIAILVTLLA